MYYKVYTSNGNYHLGYLFNINDTEQIRSYLLWELDNRYNDDLLDDDKFELVEEKIKSISLDEVKNLKDGESVRVDGFFERLDITASKSSFPMSDLSDDQKSLVGDFPW